MNDTVLGVIQAGGRSTRYGAAKALALLDDRRLVDRAHDALAAVVDRVVLIANDAAIRTRVGLPARPDIRADAGPLGGILTALLWARQEGRDGILTLACDMPFVVPALLQAILDARGAADAVLPESGGPRGVEPLCAYYGVACSGSIERRIEAGDLRMIGFHEDVRVARLPLDEVSRCGDPGRLFLNVNTLEEHVLAERVARGDDA